MTHREWRAVYYVWRKECLDLLRDRRTLFITLLSAVLLAPLLLVVLSFEMRDVEQRVQARELRVQGAEHGPSLVNYVARRGYSVRSVPDDWASQLRERQLEGAVLVIPAGFELALVRGEQPTVTVWSSSGTRGQVDANQTQALVQGFNREQVSVRLALRGVALSLMQPVQIEAHEWVGAGARGAPSPLMGLPFFVLMAVLYGTMNSALDSTAGERERGSLAPLLMNPVSPWTLVLGKWGAASGLGLLIALLSCVGFLLGRWGLRSQGMAEWFDYGALEALQFLGLLAPLASALAAWLMALAIRARSVKEGQAGCSLLVLLISLLPLLGQLGGGREASWFWGVPGLAQAALMNRVLQGESLGLGPVAISVAVCAVLTGLGLILTVRQVRSVAAH
jgi:sodium transport system permease protein